MTFDKLSDLLQTIEWISLCYGIWTLIYERAIISCTSTLRGSFSVSKYYRGVSTTTQGYSRALVLTCYQQKCPTYLVTSSTQRTYET